MLRTSIRPIMMSLVCTLCTDQWFTDSGKVRPLIKLPRLAHGVSAVSSILSSDAADVSTLTASTVPGEVAGESAIFAKRGRDSTLL